MKSSDALVLVFERNQFYRRQYLLALLAYLISLIVIVTEIGVIVYLKKNPIHPLYFATDKVGHFIQIVPKTTPNMTTEEVTAWAVEAAQAAYSYDFINYRAEFQSAQKYFTPYGWDNFLKGLQASNNMVMLKQRKVIFQAQVVEQPKIIAQGILGGAYAWKFDMPMLLFYWFPPYDENSRFRNALRITMVVQRQNILQSYKGLGVVQMIGTLPTNAPAQPK